MNTPNLPSPRRIHTIGVDFVLTIKDKLTETPLEARSRSLSPSKRLAQSDKYWSCTAESPQLVHPVDHPMWLLGINISYPISY